MWRRSAIRSRRFAPLAEERHGGSEVAVRRPHGGDRRPAPGYGGVDARDADDGGGECAGRDARHRRAGTALRAVLRGARRELHDLFQEAVRVRREPADGLHAEFRTLGWAIRVKARVSRWCGSDMIQQSGTMSPQSTVAHSRITSQPVRAASEWRSEEHKSELQ